LQQLAQGPVADTCSPASLLLKQTEPPCLLDGLGTVVCSEALEQIFQVLFDRAFRDAKRGGNLLVWHAFCQQWQNLLLPRRQRRRRVAVGGGLGGGNEQCVRKIDLPLQYPAQPIHQLLASGKFGDVAARPAVDQRADDTHIIDPRNDRNRQVGITPANGVKTIKPTHARHLQIEQQQIHRRLQRQLVQR